jgi:hypothetical protein
MLDDSLVDVLVVRYTEVVEKVLRESELGEV